MFAKRLGSDLAHEAYCSGSSGCPDIWELDDGDFAVIGTDITTAAIAKLPGTAGCGPNERIIRLPRQLLVAAKHDIPETS